MKTIGNVVAIILAAVIAYALFLLIKYLVDKEDKERDVRIEHNFKTDTCKIVNHSYQKGHSVEYEFYFNGNAYGGWYSDYDKKIKTGQLFRVEFDSTNPKFNRFIRDVCYNCD